MVWPPLPIIAPTDSLGTSILTGTSILLWRGALPLPLDAQLFVLFPFALEPFAAAACSLDEFELLACVLLAGVCCCC